MNDAHDYPLGYSEQEARRLAEQGVKQTEYRVHGVRVERLMPLTPLHVLYFDAEIQKDRHLSIWRPFAGRFLRKN